MARLGFVGVGAMSAAMVDALCTGPHAKDVQIVLSPRSADRSAALAARYSQVAIAADNQAVLDASDIVFLGVLPPQAAAVCAELNFRPNHIVASLIAGLPPTAVLELVGEVAAACQMIPLPVIALHTGPIVMSPRIPEVATLFEGSGEIVALEDESKIRILSCTSAAMSTFFEYQKTVINWTVKAGLPLDTARDYATALFAGLATEARHTPLDELDHMPAEHETPGGLNEYIRKSMVDSGAFEVLEQAFDYLYYHKNLAKSED